MNSDSNDSVSTCKRCKQRPTTSTYTNRSGKWTEQVCDPCLDILHLQETFEWGIVDTFPLVNEDRFDEVLAWIDTFERSQSAP